MLRTNYFGSLMALAAAMAASLLLFLGAALPAQAQSTITVNTTADEQNTNGKCSLREAIINANSNNQSGSTDCPAGSSTGADTITFSLAPSSTIWLNSALPVITDTAGLAIDGGQASITISGGNETQVFLVGGKLTLKNLTVSDGFTSSSGGAMNNFSSGQVEVINSTFSQNRARFGGAIINQGTLKVTNSTFYLNEATAADGGGIVNLGPLTVTNSTFYLNSAAGAGGGIDNSSGVVPVPSITVTNSTFSNNSAFQGGGIFNSTSGGTATLSNTIVANNPTGQNCVGPVTDGGYNIDDGTTCGFSAANHSQPSTDPQLDPGGLQHNGGPTRTIALLTGSPALNAIPKGTNGCGTDITTDQRGVKRPQGTGCDIGAYEKKVRHHH